VGRLCGLVMLLPHGYEGRVRSIPRGASSAICNCVRLQHPGVHPFDSGADVSPAAPPDAAPAAQTAHRVHPESLLRSKDAASPLALLAEGSFQPVIAEVDALEAGKVRRIIACSGKVYYD